MLILAGADVGQLPRWVEEGRTRRSGPDDRLVEDGEYESVSGTGSYDDMFRTELVFDASGQLDGDATMKRFNGDVRA